MTYTTILTEIRGRVGLVTLNRPQAMNAFNTLMLTELFDALDKFDANPEIGAMVVTGNEKAFAAGADIKEMAEATPFQMIQQGRVELWDRIRSLKKPVIAAVSGWALGGGCEFSISCDLIVASETAKFGQPEITIGVIPGGGGTQRLARLLGKPLAMEMVLNNRTLTAQEALQFGLVNRVAPVTEYLNEALKLAEEIAARAPLAIRMAKEAVNAAFETTLTEGLKTEKRNFYPLFSTDDQKEGMKAFIEKRPPNWTGK
ncbi:MAG: enoyl-CoA hydratase/isomerase family protein [Anaerolineales bacterium]|nr:enoyl-CoA hydratase/isomerase family protein [Anaerolineales bacterium]MCZ2122497.1 enoyl-CoA hydratase/isomerase family protein [Anaerolineales bacterium]